MADNASQVLQQADLSALRDRLDTGDVRTGDVDRLIALIDSVLQASQPPAVPAAPDGVSAIDPAVLEACRMLGDDHPVVKTIPLGQLTQFARAVLSLRQPSAEWLEEHERLVLEYGRVFHAYHSMPDDEDVTAAYVAKNKTLKDVMAHAASIGQVACSGRDSSGGGE